MSLADHIMRQHTMVRRALAMLLVFLTLAVARVALIAPAHALLLSQARWRTQARRHLASAKGRASAERTLRDQLHVLPKAPVWRQFYPSGGAQDPDTALRADLGRLTAAAEVTVQSVSTLPTVEKGALRQYGMRIAASMTIDQLERLAMGLRRQRRYLRVGHLTVSAPRVQTPHSNAVLHVRMVVYGYSVAPQGGVR